MLENGEDLDNIEITLFPPEEGQNTDEESGDENELDMNHLPRSILVEVEVSAKSSINFDLMDSMEPETPDMIPHGDENRDGSGNNDENGDGDGSGDGDSTLCEVEVEVEVSASKKRGKNSGGQVKKKKKTGEVSQLRVTRSCGTKCQAGPSNTLGQKQSSSKKKSNIAKYKWVEDEEFFSRRVGNGDAKERFNENPHPEKSCVQWFEELFSPEVITLIKEQSNLYTLMKNHELKVSDEEIKVFVAILLLTGYLSPTYMRMFWETQSDTYNALVAQSMRRDRFFEISQYLHLADNSNLPANDNFSKVRDYLNLLESNFREEFNVIWTSHVSIDETMVRYYGKHSSKQHIHGKPIKFGYKLWSLATPSGYLVTFIPYEGSANAPLPFQDQFGLGGAVVLELASRLPEEYGPYNVYFDRFFSGIKLIEELAKRNIGGTGTILENRTLKCPLEESKSLSKKERGSTSFRNTEDIILTKWNDNNIVSMISNCHGLTPFTKVERIGKINNKKAKVSVQCPNITKMYNTYMGGVDRFDQNLDSLRITFVMNHKV
ncbi:piggyBac transposable element-derived protein 3-like [Nilaparvata lugens]|uniref:piggyBac transposable element-derived protein 3-like n=1 Tax=Nilaparvata lugens TaxID=108931 RepID=UPI00193D2F88|nr:piggyBac transposable element-derived protein 3-like [Nilaparvata lugens]